MSDLYDIVIPVGPSDSDQINDQLNFTTKNIIGYRNIYLICYDTSIQIIDKSIIIIDEKTFPFTIKDVEKYHSKYDRNGWYLQQLLKLYAGLVIPGILERYLVIDADTYFLKPTVFVEDNKCLYNTGSEYHIPYFQHMLKLYPSMEKQIQESGICHHMMFEKIYSLIYGQRSRCLEDLSLPLWSNFFFPCFPALVKQKLHKSYNRDTGYP